MMFGGGFNVTKLKPQLKMACGRIQIASNKKAALLKQSTREVAVLLADDPPKEEKARIRAEALIRDDNLIEAYEILQLECELLHERIKLIQYSKECPADLVSVISTLIWASHRVDIPELLLIRKQFKAKYGKEFEENAMRNYNGCLNERVVAKLSVEPPAAYLVQTYLERICEQFHVEWTPSLKLTADQMIEPMRVPIGDSVGVAQGTGLGPAALTGVPPYATATIMDDGTSLPPPIPTAPSPSSNSFPNVPGGGRSTGGGSTISSQQYKHDDLSEKNMFDEPDIFVPKPTTSSSQSNPTHDDDKDDDDDDDKQNQDHRSTFSRSGGGGMNDSYANLAARFDSLKK